MQTEDIQAFLEIIKTGSISKASENLYISQPTLSYRIQNLEKELGYKLIERNRGKKKIESTDAGRQFYLLAERISQLCDESLEIASKPINPTYRVAATYTLDNYILPSIYEDFIKQDFPINVEFHAMHFPECYRSVESGSLDLAFLSRTSPSDKISPIYLCSDKMVLICNKNSNIPDYVHPRDLDRKHGIFLNWDKDYEKWHEYWFGIGNHMIKSDNIIHIEKLTEELNYWIMVPLTVASIMKKNKSLRVVNVKDGPNDWPIYMLTRDPDNKYTRFLSHKLIELINKPK